MEEFAKMIYEQWNAENDSRDVYFDEGVKLMDRLKEILSVPLFDDIYDTFCSGCAEVEKKAFIAGFGYACKRLSNGKIELGGAGK